MIKYKVKPFPDPDEDCEFMSSSDFVTKMLNQSRSFKELGDGKCSKIWLEVLQCTGLPNKDIFGEGKPDAFVTIVYEDCYSKTNVIDNCSSPKWMPWTDRGFCLNVRHPSTPIYLGVFDYDADVPFQSHDFIGRAVIDTTKLRPRTEYTLSYNIWDSAVKNSYRKKNGEIMVSCHKFKYCTAPN